MIDYVEQVYGHVGQLAPVHIVVNSPQFNTKEVKSAGGPTRGQFMHKYMHKADAPMDIVLKMREEGKSYNSIAVALGLPPSSIRTWCLNSLRI